MAVKKKFISGAKLGVQKLASSKLNPKNKVTVSAFELKVAPRKPARPRVKTVEQSLEDKAGAADTKIFATRSLGQMSREDRRKLLFG